MAGQQDRTALVVVEFYLGDGGPLPPFKDDADKGRKHQRAARGVPTKLPSLFSLSCACVDPGHQYDDVYRGPDVEILEDKIPPAPLWWDPEEVKVSRGEDSDVEDLRDKGNPFGAFVAMNGPDEDAFGEGVGHIGQ